MAKFNWHKLLDKSWFYTKVLFAIMALMLGSYIYGTYKPNESAKAKVNEELDILVPLYLKGLLTFQRQYDIPLIGPSNEHKVRFKWYDVMIDKKKTIKDLKKVIKDGKI